MDIFSETLQHFQKLLQFNTANPPGNERDAVNYISEVLQKEGYTPQVLESADKRANLVVRWPGDGSKKPLLITSHIDVVHAENDKWKYPPFSGTIAEECIWGRGAIDMKNMTAYCLATMLTLARSKKRYKRDVIMSVVADEEVGGDYGMGFLVSKYPDLVRAEYALGELGGFTTHIQGKRIYPVQVAEKGIFWIKVKFKGSPGHGSIPKSDNAHFQAAKFLSTIHNTQMPVRLTHSTRAFFGELARIYGPIGGLQFRLLQTSLGPKILRKLQDKGIDRDRYASLSAMLTNTVNPTGLQAGKQHNVVPSTVTVTLDCRLLPGQKGSDVVRDLEKIWGEKLEVEVVREGFGHESDIDTPLFAEIKKQVELADPGGLVVPNLTVGFTDAQYLKKLGMHCYGFTPVKFPPDMSFPELYHGHNERIPVEGFRWGLDVFLKTVTSFCQS